MRYLSTLVITLFLANAAVAQDFAWKDFRDRVDDAHVNGNRDALIEFAHERTNAPADPAEWNAYWRAYLNYRAAYLEGEEQPDEEKLRACVESGELALERGEESGESHALLGLCFGQLAGTGMMAGMRYGSKARSMLDEALLMAPDNPRVLLAAGINDLYTPSQYGGDQARAARRLEEARQTLSGRTPSDGEPWSPAWGAMDAHAHLAIALIQLERPQEALDVLHDAGEAGLESPWLDSIRRRLESSRSS